MRTLGYVLLALSLLLPSHNGTAGGGTLPAKPKPGPIGWIIIPALSLWSPIYEVPIITYVDDQQVAHNIYDMTVIPAAVGHFEGTAWIDDGGGNVVVGAHNPGRFAGLDTLTSGDRIIILSHETAREYYVVQLAYKPANDWRVLVSHPQEDALTLITCEGQSSRLIVRAT